MEKLTEQKEKEIIKRAEEFLSLYGFNPEDWIGKVDLYLEEDNDNVYLKSIITTFTHKETNETVSLLGEVIKDKKENKYISCVVKTLEDYEDYL